MRANKQKCAREKVEGEGRRKLLDKNTWRCLGIFSFGCRGMMKYTYIAYIRIAFKTLWCCNRILVHHIYIKSTLVCKIVVCKLQAVVLTAGDVQPCGVEITRMLEDHGIIHQAHSHQTKQWELVRYQGKCQRYWVLQSRTHLRQRKIRSEWVQDHQRTH